MNRRLAALVALALPLVGLAGMWASTEQWHRQGTDWLVPVTGYDPRDLLRGHYVQFRYAWPGAEEAQFDATATVEPEHYPFGGCITGTAPAIARVVKLASEADRAACAHPLAPGDTSMFGTPDLPRDGRLYVAQTAGQRLEEQLRDPDMQGMIRVRLRSDGTVTPLELTFRPRPPAADPARADNPVR
jgi:hypothetical protein